MPMMSDSELGDSPAEASSVKIKFPGTEAEERRQLASDRFLCNKHTAISLLAILGGGIFGFELAIISGAKVLYETPTQFNIEGDDFLLGLSTAAMTLGAMIGTLVAGATQVCMGRKRTIVLFAAVYSVGVITCILSLLDLQPVGVSILIVGRVLVGSAVGAFSSVCPVYIAEISPSHVRGKLVSSVQVWQRFCLCL